MHQSMLGRCTPFRKNMLVTACLSWLVATDLFCYLSVSVLDCKCYVENKYKKMILRFSSISCFFSMSQA
jgi:hypothetical protein